jgi:hypothetical protein
MEFRRALFGSFVLAGMLMSTHPALAEDTCPALNRARASSALGAEADLSVEWHAASDYVCTYTAATGTLTVTVGPYHARDGWPSYSARCLATPQAISGIGNEAVFCSKTGQGEVIAHVTDTLLDVSLTLAKPSAQLEDTLRQVAGTVASNLR